MTTFGILIMFLFVGCEASSITGRVFNNQGVDGKMFSERIMFNSYTHSFVECAHFCHDLNCCLTFTFNEVTHLCQGHFAVVTANTPSSPANGAMTFSRENNEAWLSRNCTNNDECPAVSECGVECNSDSGQCSCSPYFYYSVSLNACVPSCSAPHTTYVQYVDHDLWGNDLGYHTAHILDCKNWCNSNLDCRLIVRDPSAYGGPRCYFKSATAAEHPDSWKKVGRGFLNFQKTCA